MVKQSVVQPYKNYSAMKMNELLINTTYISSYGIKLIKVSLKRLHILWPHTQNIFGLQNLKSIEQTRGYLGVWYKWGVCMCVYKRPIGGILQWWICFVSGLYQCQNPGCDFVL